MGEGRAGIVLVDDRHAKGVATAVNGGNVVRVMDIGYHEGQIMLPGGKNPPDCGFAFRGTLFCHTKKPFAPEIAALLKHAATATHGGNSRSRARIRGFWLDKCHEYV